MTTTVTDYLKDKSFIKLLTKQHFAFMGHDLNKGKDSARSSPAAVENMN
jgi:hypothetical protein